MRILIFDSIYLEVQQIQSVIEKELFTVFGVATESEVGEHLFFGQFDYVVLGKNIKQELHKRVSKLAEEKGTQVIEIKKGNENTEKYTRNHILPELLKAKNNDTSR